MMTSAKSKACAMWATVLLGVAWILYRLLNNTGWILDDEISHYLFSRSVWENPDQLFNHWTRPGRNWLHCLAAPLGFTGTRLFTLALALVSVWVTYQLGKLLKVKALWVVPMMALFQSWFPELSYPVLTQTPFMLFWILGVWFGVSKRWHLAGFCFGYLSLIRHEGILLTGIWGLWLTFSEGGFGRHILDMVKGKESAQGLLAKLGRDALYGVSTVSAIVVYNFAAYIYAGTFPFGVYFESKPTTMYGSGTLYHYVPKLFNGVGGLISILSLVGVFAIRKKFSDWSLLLATYPTYFILHSLIYWKGAFASGGYYHFLMPMVPFFALLAAEGIGVICGDGKVKWRNALAAVSVGMVLFQGVNMAHHQVCYQNWAAIMAGDAEPEYSIFAKPMCKGELSTHVVEASNWAAEAYPNQPVLAKHVAHNFTQRTLFTGAQVEVENAPLYTMPVGTVFIWDRQYCEYENRIKFSSFDESQDWKIVKKWKRAYPGEDKESPTDLYTLVVFEKVSKLDKADKKYAELGEADKVDQIYE